jgi:hypothetical protein
VGVTSSQTVHQIFIRLSAELNLLTKLISCLVARMRPAAVTDCGLLICGGRRVDSATVGNIISMVNLYVPLADL